MGDRVTVLRDVEMIDSKYFFADLAAPPLAYPDHPDHLADRSIPSSRRAFYDNRFAGRMPDLYHSFVKAGELLFEGNLPSHVGGIGFIRHERVAYFVILSLARCEGYRQAGCSTGHGFPRRHPEQTRSASSFCS